MVNLLTLLVMTVWLFIAYHGRIGPYGRSREKKSSGHYSVFKNGDLNNSLRHGVVIFVTGDDSRYR